MISFERVTKRFNNGFTGLSEVSFFLERGDIVFLTGHSGAGKSTLIKLIMGMKNATKGRVVVANYDVQGLSRSQMPFYRRNIGLVFQDHQLLFDRTVFDNVALPLIISGGTEMGSIRRVQTALDMVGLLDKAKNMPASLSSGQQQRVGLARAIVNRPAIILADEPTGNLDPELSAEVMQLFENFNQIGVTVLIASHDLRLVAKMRHRILTLEHGKLISDQEVI